MGYSKAIWDLDDDPHGNVQHIAEHDITKKEVLESPDGIETSRSSGRPMRLAKPVQAD